MLGMEKSKDQQSRKGGNPAWHKGMASPNPVGRPRVQAEITELARRECPKAIRRLAWLRDNSDSHAVQLAASVALLDRGYGRPPMLIATADMSPKIVVVAAPEKVIDHAP
jgi:hypothetical protein